MVFVFPNILLINYFHLLKRKLKASEGDISNAYPGRGTSFFLKSYNVQRTRGLTTFLPECYIPLKSVLIFVMSHFYGLIS